MTRLVVLASGNGSNLQVVIDACASRAMDARIVAVFSDRPAALALERARAAGLPAIALPVAAGQPRRDYDAALADAVAAYVPDHVMLLGWMRLLSGAFLARFPGRVVNLHPALPGAFPGTHAIERALRAFQAGAVGHTGVMTHFVPDEGIDCGPVIRVETVPIYPRDALEELEARIHAAEHRIVLETLKGLCGPQARIIKE